MPCHQLQRLHQPRVVEVGHAVGGAHLHQLRRAGGLRQGHVEFARALGVALPNTAMAAQLMQACAAAGLADMDHSALVQALEGMAQHAVAGGG